MPDRPISVLERLEASEARELERGVKRLHLLFQIAGALGGVALAVELGGVLPTILQGGWLPIDLHPQIYRPAQVGQELRFISDLGIASLLLAFTLTFCFRPSKWRSFLGWAFLLLGMAVTVSIGYLRSGLTSTMLPLFAPLVILGVRGAVHMWGRFTGRVLAGS